MLTVVTWLWGEKFNLDDVEKLEAGVRRNLKQPHRFACVTDKGFGNFLSWPILDEALTRIPGCFARLRMFSPAWQQRFGVTDRLVCIDLDTVITGQLDPLFDRPEPFVIMQGGNSANPCPYNGALMMLRPGTHPEVWADFTVEAAENAPFYEFPDDQGWIWYKIPNAPGWKCGPESGVYVFHKPGWPGWNKRSDQDDKDSLPSGARLVTFSGWRSPRRFEHLDWVKANWHA